MPRIFITTEPMNMPDAGVMLDERIASDDLASDHFAAQLIERIGWALADAESTEHQPIGHREPARGEGLPHMFLQGGH
jgi:hypothetical protein